MGDHYLYVIGTIRDGKLSAPCKVGITGNWASRLKAVQTGSAYKVGYAWVFNMPGRDMARELERSFHIVQKKHALSGEWFDLSPWVAAHMMCLNIGAALMTKGAQLSLEEKQLSFDLTRASECLRVLKAPQPNFATGKFDQE